MECGFEQKLVGHSHQVPSALYQRGLVPYQMGDFVCSVELLLVSMRHLRIAQRPEEWMPQLPQKVVTTPIKEQLFIVYHCGGVERYRKWVQSL